MPTKIFELFHQLSRDHDLSKTQAVARRTRRGKLATTIVSQPTPKGIGSAQIGLQLNGGNFLIDGELVKEPDYVIWDVESDNTAFQTKAHSFYWLDHLVANGEKVCLSKSKEWFAEWLVRYGDGDNDAWTPELAGNRIIRMINHAIVLLSKPDELNASSYFATISHHARFLKKRWQFTPNGLPKFQALVGRVYSALALEEFADDLTPALNALGKECDAFIAQDGGIPTRNPEELLGIFMLLIWVDLGVIAAGKQPNRALLDAVERIAPAIRTLRIGDGRLVEFHAGRAANATQVDQILLDAGARAETTLDKAMGYVRMSARGSLLVLDAGNMPVNTEGRTVCESALAFEFSADGHRVFNSIGTGGGLSAGQRAANLRNAGFTVASLSQPLSVDTRVSVLTDERPVGEIMRVKAQHTGYVDASGLTYTRQLELNANGRILYGVDTFKCAEKKHQKTFDKSVIAAPDGAVSFALRFHIAPDVDAELDLGGTAISLKLLNNEIWIFKASGGELTLEKSVYNSSERLQPRATKQIVVTSHVVNYEGVVTWMLTRLVQERH